MAADDDDGVADRRIDEAPHPAEFVNDAADLTAATALGMEEANLLDMAKLIDIG